MTILYWIGLLFFILPFLVFFNGPKEDRRFKTEYKDNEEPLGCLYFILWLFVAYVVGFGLMKAAHYFDSEVDFFGIVSIKEKEKTIESLSLISDVNLRSKPNASNSEVIRVAKKYEELSDPIIHNEEWYKAYDKETKQSIFVHNNYVELTKEVIYNRSRQRGNLPYFICLGIAMIIMIYLTIPIFSNKNKIKDEKSERSKPIKSGSSKDLERAKQIYLNYQSKELQFESANDEYLNLIYGLKSRIDEVTTDLNQWNNPQFLKLRKNFNNNIKSVLQLDYLDALSFINPKINLNPSKDAIAFCYLFHGDNEHWKECLVKGKCSKGEWKNIQKLFKVNDEPLKILALLSKLNYPHINKYIALINQIALVLCKSDGVITPEEKALLKDLRGITSSFADKDIYFSNSHHKARTQKNLDYLLQELNSLIGLSSVKEEVISMINFLKIQNERSKQGLKNIDLSLHCIFKGPPGTGKTTIARILSEIYFELGFLNESKLIETDRSGLVAEYVGQTAIKTNKIIDDSINGVLFIDEAYMLYNKSGNDYGREAIGILLKRMEDDRKNFAVIMAGYPKEMNDLISLNPGLESRINRYITFEEFNAQELYDIFLLMCDNSEYELNESAKKNVFDYIKILHKNRTNSFGNAREMRNLFEDVIENQAMRLASNSKLSSQDLIQLTTEDIPSVDSQFI